MSSFNVQKRHPAISDCHQVRTLIEASKFMTKESEPKNHRGRINENEELGSVWLAVGWVIFGNCVGCRM